MQTLSIIIAVYNVEEYLEKCLESVLNQNCPNLEVILVNDGSTDNSLSICQKFVKNYNNVRLINQKNSGTSIARNNGFNYSKGDYVWFVDSDDWIENDSINYLIKQINEEETEMFEFSMRFYFNETKQFKETLIAKETISTTNGKDYIQKNKRMSPPAWLYIYKRTFLLNNNLYFRENIYFEDEYFNWECFFKVEKIRKVTIVLYNYRVRSDSKMTIIPSIERLNSYFDMMEIISSARKIKLIDNDYFNEKLSQYSVQFTQNLAISRFSFYKKASFLKSFKRKYPLILLNYGDTKRVLFEKKLYNLNVLLFYFYYSMRSINNDSFFDIMIFNIMKFARYFRQIAHK